MLYIYILSQVFIIIQYILLAITYQSKQRKKIVIFNLASLISAGISYMLLSAYSGFAMIIVAIIRNIIFIIDEKKNGKSNRNGTKDYIILAFLLIISLISAICTYNGPLSMLSVIASSLYTYSVWQKNTKVYKVLGIPISTLWILYYIYIFSIFGIILETALLISSIIGFKKEKQEKYTFLF